MVNKYLCTLQNAKGEIEVQITLFASSTKLVRHVPYFTKFGTLNIENEMNDIEHILNSYLLSLLEQ